MFVLVGELEIAEESALDLVGELSSDAPSPLSFLPNTRPRMPPLVEERFSEGPASLTAGNCAVGKK